MIRSNEGQNTISFRYHDEQYPVGNQVSRSTPSFSLPSTLQGALQGALMSHEGSRRAGHHQGYI